jgi:hypothetical protein
MTGRVGDAFPRRSLPIASPTPESGHQLTLLWPKQAGELARAELPGLSARNRRPEMTAPKVRFAPRRP